MVSGVYVGGGLRWSMWSGHHAVGQDGRRALTIGLSFGPEENWLSFILFSFLTIELMNQGLL